MLIPIDKNVKYEYSLIGDDGDFKTLFQLGYLTARQKAALALQTKKVIKETDEPLMWWWDIIKHGLRGWSNFKTADANELEFKTEKVSVPGFGEFELLSNWNLEHFKIEWIAELAGKLYEINYPSIEEKKS